VPSNDRILVEAIRLVYLDRGFIWLSFDGTNPRDVSSNFTARIYHQERQMREPRSNAIITRRTFLRTVGVGASALVIFPGLELVLSARASEPPSKSEDKTTWKSLFDGKTLTNWKPTDFGNSGKAFVKDGVVILEKGNQMTGITYSRGDFPKTDYELSLEGKRVDGDDFFCTTTFPVGKSYCSLVVGGWGGTTVGLSSINSADASENETSTAKEFKQNVWYQIRIRVRPDKILAWIDTEKMVDLDIEDRKITTRLECNPCKPFGIATWCTTGAVRNIRVRPLTADEKKTPGAKKD
jgi:hypothetical protein